MEGGLYPLGIGEGVRLPKSMKKNSKQAPNDFLTEKYNNANILYQEIIIVAVSC